MMRKLNGGKIIYPELSYKLNGILFEARKAVGRFGNEQQYCDAIEKLLQEKKINYEREKTLPVSFEGEKHGRNRVDFLIQDKIVVEIKAKPFITKEDYYQTRRYLAALGKKLAILANMHRYYVQPKRILNSQADN